MDNRLIFTLAFGWAFLALSNLSAQKNVTLSITHTLNGKPFAYEQKATNNLGYDVKVSRLDYILSKIALFHDGGKVTPIDSTYFLIRNGEKFEVSLGEFDLATLDSIRFLVGVDSLENHSDPALWPTGHALAPTWPDMHWGWQAGYRFVAIEGNNGPDFFYHFELHPLGDALRRNITLKTSGVEVETGIHIPLQAECSAILAGINFSKVVFEHGSGKEAIGVMNNMQSKVFSVMQNSSVLNEATPQILRAGPNPSSDGMVRIHVEGKGQEGLLRIRNFQGKLIEEREFSGLTTDIHLPFSGMYVIELVDSRGNLTATNTLIRL